ncbi:hypothetical protein IJU85_00955 [Candidatus Saccharibacteria bacterium]|nr:hypothetical protein [Candidatus Saccharibacteria bacterium]
MTKKSRRKTERQRGIAIGVIVGIVVLLIVCTVAAFIRADDLNHLDKSYFVTNDRKIVLEMTSDISSLQKGEYEPRTTYVVYYCNGEEIVDAKVFFEYAAASEAKAAYENIDVDEKDWATSKQLSHDYVIFEADKSQYDGLMAKQVRSMV